MITITDKALCSGCSACANVCPQTCIEMKTDEEGFWYPSVDNSRCINCSRCEKSCPIITNVGTDTAASNAFYAAVNKEEDVRMNSSSGGAFSVLAEYVLEQNGVVFGAAFDDNFEVAHVAITTKDELHRLRGSKYVQSRIGESFRAVKQYLDDGRLVLFSGTLCQVSGLKAFLGKEYENLITQDIICHGVPSPLIWKQYKDVLQQKAESKIVSVNFRNKTTGWRRYSFVVAFENGSVFSTRAVDDPYFAAFLKDLTLRRSCYNCHFKSVARISDLTLADLWGAEELTPDYSDNKGVSLVVTHSKKGEALLRLLSDKLLLSDVDCDAALKHNPSMVRSAPLPENRDAFMQTVRSGKLLRALRQYTKKNKLVTALKKARRVLVGLRRSSAK